MRLAAVFQIFRQSSHWNGQPRRDALEELSLSRLRISWRCDGDPPTNHTPNLPFPPRRGEYTAKILLPLNRGSWQRSAFRSKASRNGHLFFCSGSKVSPVPSAALSKKKQLATSAPPAHGGATHLSPPPFSPRKRRHLHIFLV